MTVLKFAYNYTFIKKKMREHELDENGPDSCGSGHISLNQADSHATPTEKEIAQQIVTC